MTLVHIPRSLADGRQLPHGRDGIQDEYAAPAEDPDVVIEGMFGRIAEREFLCPIELVRLRIVGRRLCPSDELDGGKAGLLPLVVVLRGTLAHLLQQRSVVNRSCIIVVDVAVLVEGDDDAPAFARERAESGRNEHAQHRIGGIRRISPRFRQQTPAAFLTDEAERLGQTDGRDASRQRDVSRLVPDRAGWPCSA